MDRVGQTMDVEVCEDSRHAGSAMLTRFIMTAAILGACAYSPPGEDGDGPPTIGFEFATSGSDEEVGTVMIPVVLSRSTDKDVSVRYTAHEVTAEPAVDFRTTSNTLTIPAGQVTASIPVQILFDDDGGDPEPVETFEIELAMPQGAVLAGDRSVHTVTISDVLLPRVVFDSISTTTNEGSPTDLLVKLTRGPKEPSTVVLGVAGGGQAPASPEDHGLVDGLVIEFAVDQTEVTIPIGEVDDELDEEDTETLVLTLKGASTNLVLGDLTSTTHDIDDNDDPPTVEFLAADSTAAEDGGDATIEVRLDAPSGRTVTVDYARSGNDTALDDDATVSGSPGTLTFAPGEVSKSISVAISDDLLNEDNETVIVVLSNPSNASLGTDTHTLTIDDEDPLPSVEFPDPSDQVEEDEPGGVSVTVELSAASGRTVTVPFSLDLGKTSAETEDFSIVTPSPLVFAPGITTRTITINVPITSPGNEFDDDVVIDLDPPTNATLGQDAEYTLTIKE